MRISDLFLGCCLIMMASMFYCGWRALEGIVSGFDPYRVRVIPSYGRRTDYSDEGWRFRKRAIASQVLALLFALLWIVLKEAGK